MKNYENNIQKNNIKSCRHTKHFYRDLIMKLFFFLLKETNFYNVLGTNNSGIQETLLGQSYLNDSKNSGKS